MDFPRRSAFIEWDEDGREYYEERAAILEFEAGLPATLGREAGNELVREIFNALENNNDLPSGW